MQPTLPQTAGTADMDMTAVQSMDWFFKKEQIYLLAQFWQQVNSPLSQLFIIIIIISKIRKAIFGERAEGCDRYWIWTWIIDHMIAIIWSLLN